MCRAIWTVGRPSRWAVRWPCRPGIAQRRCVASSAPPNALPIEHGAAAAGMSAPGTAIAGRLLCCMDRMLLRTSSPCGDMESFFATDWQVHYNSSRTGVRLIGPKPHWARRDGGEAGLHPSNIHDNPYAIGAIDFTGDMPVILGPDGPESRRIRLSGNALRWPICWKIGQLQTRRQRAFSRRRCRAGAVAAADAG